MAEIEKKPKIGDIEAELLEIYRDYKSIQKYKKRKNKKHKTLVFKGRRGFVKNQRGFRDLMDKQ